MHNRFSKWKCGGHGGASQGTLKNTRSQNGRQNCNDENDVGKGVSPEHHAEDDDEHKHEKAFRYLDTEEQGAHREALELRNGKNDVDLSRTEKPYFVGSDGIYLDGLGLRIRIVKPVYLFS